MSDALADAPQRLQAVKPTAADDDEVVGTRRRDQGVDRLPFIPVDGPNVPQPVEVQRLPTGRGEHAKRRPQPLAEHACSIESAERGRRTVDPDDDRGRELVRRLRLAGEEDRARCFVEKRRRRAAEQDSRGATLAVAS